MAMEGVPAGLPNGSRFSSLIESTTGGRPEDLHHVRDMPRSTRL